MDLAAVGAAGAAQRLAVDSDHDPAPAWPGRGRRRDPAAQPSGKHGGQQVSVQAGQQPPDRGRGRDVADESEPGSGNLVQVVQPVGDRRERRRAGGDGAHRDGQQPDEGVARSTRTTGVRDRG